MQKQKTYTTRRLELRPLKPSDYKVWLRAQENCLPKQDKYDSDPPPVERRTLENFKKAVGLNLQAAKEDRFYLWSIFLKTTGEFIGWIDVSTIARAPYQMANLGYFVINIHRGQGYAKEATRRVIKGAFTDLGFHRLEAITDPQNKLSIKTAKACGLTREGIKKHYWFQNNRWEDQLVFITTPELFK